MASKRRDQERGWYYATEQCTSLGVEYEYRVNLESRQYLKAKDDETRVGNDEGVDAPCKDYHQSPRPPLLLQHILGLVDLARKVW